MKRTIKVVALVGALLLLAAYVCLSYAQPLLSSRDFTVTAILDGVPLRAELLHPPFISGTYYLHLPGEPEAIYRWFGIAFPRQSVFVPVALHANFGIPYIHNDQAKGVRLTDGKIEDHWNVAFTSNDVRFSNASLSISLDRRP